MKGRELITRFRSTALDSRALQPVLPILIAFSAICLTTVVLLAVDSILGAKALVFVYLLPTIAMAMHYGSTVAVLTSFASSLAAAYFFFPPKFSFYIADPLNVAQLGFFLLLAVIASKAVEVVANGSRERRPTLRSKWHLCSWNPVLRISYCTHYGRDWHFAFPSRHHFVSIGCEAGHRNLFRELLFIRPSVTIYWVIHSHGAYPNCSATEECWPRCFLDRPYDEVAN